MDDQTRKTTVGFVQLIIVLGVLLFAPSWTLDFWHGVSTCSCLRPQQH